MVNESAPDEARPAPPLLKVEEPKIDPDKPWCDDELDRQKIADRLTTVIKDQEAPFVISLDGRWGTGKTFLLKRWQAQLVNDGFQAIYFNAWEDDFCDDPLLAIIGQLAEHFQEGKLKAMATRIGEVALPILTGRFLGVSLKREDLSRKDLLADYRIQLRTKREIRERLTDLAALVRNETDQPLVFIIDELDRCRPTFAIELLERVKHIFDVRHIVFVFGINRTELTKSVQSIYGDIDASVYLRRFFDMEFVLPEADPETFCRHLLQRYDLWSYFRHAGQATPYSSHVAEYSAITRELHQFFGQLGLSLRDMEYCLRVLALATRGLSPRRTLFPYALVALISTKVASIELYRGFMSGEVTGGAIIDYIYERPTPTGEGSSKWLGDDDATRVWIEAAMYCIDDYRTITQMLSSDVHSQGMSNAGLLSQRIRQGEDREFASQILERMRNFRGINSSLLLNRSYIAGLIELSAEPDRS